MRRVNIFIDTSVLPRHPWRRGQAMDTLVELAQSGAVQVITSEVVVRERESQIRKDVLGNVEDLGQAIRCLKRQPWLEELSSSKTIDELASNEGRMSREAAEIAARVMRNLIEDLKAEVLTVSDMDGSWVIDAYFEGRPPFREVKAKEDFPDGFIFCAAEQAARRYGGIQFICADGRLKASLDRSPRSVVYGGLKEFFESEIGIELQNTLRFARLWVPAKRKETLEFLPTVATSLASRVEVLVRDNLEDTVIQDSCIPEDNSEATITCANDVSDVDFDWTKLDEIGPGWVEVPVTATADVELWFRIFRSDAYDVPDWVNVDYGDPEKEHYFDAYGQLKVRVATSLIIRFTEDELSDEESHEPDDLELGEFDRIEVVDPDGGSW